MITLNQEQMNTFGNYQEQKKRRGRPFGSKNKKRTSYEKRTYVRRERDFYADLQNAIVGLVRKQVAEEIRNRFN